MEANGSASPIVLMLSRNKTQCFPLPLVDTVLKIVSFFSYDLNVLDVSYLLLQEVLQATSLINL